MQELTPLLYITSTPRGPHRACCAALPWVAVDSILKRVDQLLGWERLAGLPGLARQRLQLDGSPAWTFADELEERVVLLLTQEVERDDAVSLVQQKPSVLLGASSVGLPEHCEKSSQVLLVGGIDRLATRPEVEAAP